MIGVAQTGINEGKDRAGIMLPVPGFSMYQARLLQHNSYQVYVVNYGMVGYGVMWNGMVKAPISGFNI